MYGFCFKSKGCSPCRKLSFSAKPHTSLVGGKNGKIPRGKLTYHGKPWKGSMDYWISDFPYVNLSWREFIQNAWQFLAVEVPFLDFPKEIPVNSIFDSPSFSQNLREILQKRVPSPVSMVKRHGFFSAPKGEQQQAYPAGGTASDRPGGSFIGFGREVPQ